MCVILVDYPTNVVKYRVSQKTVPTLCFVNFSAPFTPNNYIHKFFEIGSLKMSKFSFLGENFTEKFIKTFIENEITNNKSYL